MKKIIFRKGIIIWSFILIFISCDNIQEPFFENLNNTGEEEITEKNILIFDFTAFRCSGCPRAQRTIESIHELYGDKVIPISIHMGTLAIPETTGSAFIYDFRTNEGEEMMDYFVPLYLPIGLVNSYSIDSLIPHSDWPALVASLNENESDIRLLPELSYFSGSKTVKYSIDIELLKNNTKDLYLAMFIIENGIIAWQSDQDSPDRYSMNYEHNNVFRYALTGIWGESIGDGMNSYGDKISRNYETKINDEWIPENLFIISFVYDFISKEVLQVEKTGIIPE